ncbi:MAG: hypothetical protein M1838_002246 [Thelocarpon superellum]|nr:MAG: hypothetical protein M1838_002246 [Thelocarpon superellum]
MNGVLTTPTAPGTVTAFASPGKRKRRDSHEATRVNGVEENGTSTAPLAPGARRPSFFTDLLQIIKRHDPEPSILNHPLVPATESPKEPNGKRIKTSAAAANPPPTIASNVAAGSYTKLSEVMADVSQACAGVVVALEATPATDPSATTASLTIGKVLAFKDMLVKTVLADPLAGASETHSKPEPMDHATEEVENGVADGAANLAVVGESPSYRVALTLYGSAPQPRQLFSSVQKPVSVAGAPSQAGTKRVLTPLREAGLPNGISTTKIVSVPAANDGVKKPALTLGDLFPPPAALAQLMPPKQSKHSTTRGATVGWLKSTDLDSASRSNRRGTYTTQPLTTARWLSYNVPGSASDPTSSDARRQQRERALSVTEARPVATPETEVVAKHSREEAMFRRAYSAFAPSRDNSAAIVPDVVKSEVWWDRVGSKRFERWLGRDVPPASSDHELPRVEEVHDQAMEDDITEDAIESWRPDEPPAPGKTASATTTEESQTEKEVSEILKDVSDLLETVNSYQRIRHLSLTPATARPAIGPNATVASLTGSPSTPSVAELETYQMLKSQLSLLISTLPPYAVAKLDGDQLAALNITPIITLEGADYRGVMEEEELAPRTRSGAYHAAVGPPSRSSGSTGPYGTPPNGRGAYAPQMSNNRSGAPPTGQYYAPQPSPGRTPGRMSSQYQGPRPPAGAVGYPSPYGQPGRPAQGPYGPGTPGQYYQQPAYPPNQVPPGSNTPYQRPSQPAYQQNAQRKQAAPYNANALGGGRSKSPQKGGEHAHAPVYPPTPQPSSRGYFQTPGANPAPVAPASSIGASGFHTYMTAEQQASMMERQRAQIAANAAQTRAAAAHAAGATPPPPPLPLPPSTQAPMASTLSQAPQANGIRPETTSSAEKTGATTMTTTAASSANGGTNGTPTTETGTEIGTNAS